MRRHFPHDQSAWLKDIFQGLDEATAQSLKDAGTRYILDPAENLPSIKNAMVRIEGGLLKMAVASDDRSLTVALFGPNDTICSPLFHSWDDELYYIQAQEPSEVIVIPQEAVLPVAASNQEFAGNLTRQLSWGTWQLLNTIHMLAFYNLPQRVAQVLLNLATIFGRADQKGGIRLGLRFTQEELAELAGARRETLSTVLQDFREEGILDLRYARIDIKDIDALRRLAGTPPLPFLEKNPLVAG